MNGSHRPSCQALTEVRPHAYGYAARFIPGWRCPAHSPSAENGRPESKPISGWPPGPYWIPRHLERQDHQ
ncbi:hypothetical protein [Streptomyces liangshanensis]|uniref:hypothetical protein n=1 Tax=Streptomyces liangshanensis TaxID=2717324 RepID=UPI0036DC89D5